MNRYITIDNGNYWVYTLGSRKYRVIKEPVYRVIDLNTYTKDEVENLLKVNGYEILSETAIVNTNTGALYEGEMVDIVKAISLFQLEGTTFEIKKEEGWDI